MTFVKTIENLNTECDLFLESASFRKSEIQPEIVKGEIT